VGQTEAVGKPALAGPGEVHDAWFGPANDPSSIDQLLAERCAERAGEMGPLL
jgi:hypothetical protein